MFGGKRKKDKLKYRANFLQNYFDISVAEDVGRKKIANSQETLTNFVDCDGQMRTAFFLQLQFQI